MIYQAVACIFLGRLVASAIEIRKISRSAFAVAALCERRKTAVIDRRYRTGIRSRREVNPAVEGYSKTGSVCSRRRSCQSFNENAWAVQPGRSFLQDVHFTYRPT